MDICKRMEFADADGHPLGFVDKPEGDLIKLTGKDAVDLQSLKNDPE
jgi:hypothetical protein